MALLRCVAESQVLEAQCLSGAGAVNECGGVVAWRRGGVTLVMLAVLVVMLAVLVVMLAVLVVLLSHGSVGL